MSTKEEVKRRLFVHCLVTETAKCFLGNAHVRSNDILRKAGRSIWRTKPFCFKSPHPKSFSKGEGFQKDLKIYLCKGNARFSDSVYQKIFYYSAQRRG